MVLQLTKGLAALGQLKDLVLLLLVFIEKRACCKF